MSVKQVHIERSCYQSTTALDYRPSKKTSRDIYIDLLDRALLALQEGKEQAAADEKDVPIHNVDLALEKVVELHYHYHLNTKLVAGANNLLGAISGSPAGRVRTILNELSHEKHEARYKLSGLESEFKEFLGYLHIEPKSLIGHGRLSGGDIYEVTIKSGAQKIKTNCKIDSSLQQKWKDTEKSLKITYHDQITIKVVDKRKFGRYIGVGEVTFSLMNLLSVRPLNVVVALGTCSSLRLNFTLAWTPVVKGQQINFDPWGQLPFQDTAIGGLCQGLLRNKATSMAQLQQLNNPACSKGLTSAVSMMSLAVEPPEQPLAALLQDTIILYEDFELQFSEVKELLSSLRQLRIDLHPAPAGIPITGTMSSASSSQDGPAYYGSTDNVSSSSGGPTNPFSHIRDYTASSYGLNSESPSSSPLRDTRWISESMRPRSRKKSIFSSVRQKKYKRYNVPVAPLFNNYDQTLKRTRLSSKSEQVDRFLAIHLQLLQDVCSNLQCSYLLKARQASTLALVREHSALFQRVREFVRERGDLVAVTLEPALLEDRWRGLWNVISDDRTCLVNWKRLGSALGSHYGQLAVEDMFKFLVQCITDSTNTKYNDTNCVTVCQVMWYFREHASGGVGRFMRQFAQEYSTVHGLHAHLLRTREEALDRFNQLPFSPTKFRIAMCLLGSPRLQSVAQATFTEIKNSETMRVTAGEECIRGLEDASPHVRHCAAQAIDLLNVTESVQLLQRIAAVDLDHIRQCASVSLTRWGFKEDPLKEGVHPYLSIKLDTTLSPNDILHFALKIPAAAPL